LKRGGHLRAGRGDFGAGILAAAFGAAAVAGCGIATDPATRLAADLEDAAGRLPAREGATDALHHATPSRPGQCDGPYKVQLDRVGAMIVWCKDAAGNTVSSHSTSSHSRAVDTSQTFIVDKGAGETLIIDLTRRDGRAVITGVR
jgi:hypothetical protein